MNYQLLQGDNRAVLDAMPAKSIHAIITSPPYFGLRAYSGDQQVEWPTVEYAPLPGLPSLRIQGCEPGCKHKWADGPKSSQRLRNGTESSKIGGTPRAGGELLNPTQGAYCQLCGGWRGGLGNEPTLEAYIGHLILCLRSWHRVLRDDGCAFVNLGDSFAAKDLQMVPARFALAAQADGWYVRSRIIWAKGVSFLPDYAGSCMPESVEDRPTKSDEDIYLLTKQPSYYWDNEAVKEQSKGQTGLAASFKRATKDHLIPNQSATQHRLNREDTTDTGGRSLRSVWVINPQGYDGAHFAVWPEKLVAPMVKASTSEYGCCAQCGAPWERVVESESSGAAFGNVDGRIGEKKSITTGWQATCTCAADVIPCTVCDPFVGSGTTVAVAVAHGRTGIGIDLGADYITLAHERIREAINDSGRAYIAPVCKVADFVDLPLFGG